MERRAAVGNARAGDKAGPCCVAKPPSESACNASGDAEPLEAASRASAQKQTSAVEPVRTPEKRPRRSLGLSPNASPSVTTRRLSKALERQELQPQRLLPSPPLSDETHGHDITNASGAALHGTAAAKRQAPKAKDSSSEPAAKRPPGEAEAAATDKSEAKAEIEREAECEAEDESSADHLHDAQAGGDAAEAGNRESGNHSETRTGQAQAGSSAQRILAHREASQRHRQHCKELLIQRTADLSRLEQRSAELSQEAAEVLGTLSQLHATVQDRFREGQTGTPPVGNRKKSQPSASARTTARPSGDRPMQPDADGHGATAAGGKNTALVQPSRIQISADADAQGQQGSPSAAANVSLNEAKTSTPTARAADKVAKAYTSASDQDQPDSPEMADHNGNKEEVGEGLATAPHLTTKLDGSPRVRSAPPASIAPRAAPISIGSLRQGGRAKRLRDELNAKIQNLTSNNEELAQQAATLSMLLGQLRITVLAKYGRLPLESSLAAGRTNAAATTMAPFFNPNPQPLSYNAWSQDLRGLMTGSVPVPQQAYGCVGAPWSTGMDQPSASLHQLQQLQTQQQQAQQLLLLQHQQQLQLQSHPPANFTSQPQQLHRPPQLQQPPSSDLLAWGSSPSGLSFDPSLQGTGHYAQAMPMSTANEQAMLPFHAGHPCDVDALGRAAMAEHGRSAALAAMMPARVNSLQPSQSNQPAQQLTQLPRSSVEQAHPEGQHQGSVVQAQWQTASMPDAPSACSAQPTFAAQPPNLSSQQPRELASCASAPLGPPFPGSVSTGLPSMRWLFQGGTPGGSFPRASNLDLFERRALAGAAAVAQSRMPTVQENQRWQHVDDIIMTLSHMASLASSEQPGPI